MPGPAEVFRCKKDDDPANRDDVVHAAVVDAAVDDTATADATLLASPISPEPTGTECSISPLNGDIERVSYPMHSSALIWRDCA